MYPVTPSTPATDLYVYTTLKVNHGQITPTLTSASSFESILVLKTPQDETPPKGTPVIGAINLNESVFIDSAPSTPELKKSIIEAPQAQKITTKRDWMITATQALAHKEQFHCAGPALRPGATPLFAPSFNKLNMGPTRSVYSGLPTMGDRGVWLSTEETIEYRKELLATKKHLIKAKWAMEHMDRVNAKEKSELWKMASAFP